MSSAMRSDSFLVAALRGMVALTLLGAGAVLLSTLFGPMLVSTALGVTPLWAGGWPAPLVIVALVLYVSLGDGVERSPWTALAAAATLTAVFLVARRAAPDPAIAGTSSASLPPLSFGGDVALCVASVGAVWVGRRFWAAISGPRPTPRPLRRPEPPHDDQ